MAWVPVSGANASEGKMIRTGNGCSVFVNGAFYVLKSASTAYASSSTETSIFTGDTSTSSPIVVWLGTPPTTQYPGSTRYLPAGSLAEGTMFHGDFYGKIANTSTPNLQLRLGLVNAAGTFTAIADTTATAMSNEGTACYFHVDFGFNVQAYSQTAGILNAYVGCEYAPTLISIYSPVLQTTSFDTTQPYTLDCRATWGSNSASNTLQIAWGAIEVIG